MIFIARKGPSPELLLISDGDFFEEPSILVKFPISGTGTRGASSVPDRPIVLVYVRGEVPFS